MGLGAGLCGRRGLAPWAWAEGRREVSGCGLGSWGGLSWADAPAVGGWQAVSSTQTFVPAVPARAPACPGGHLLQEGFLTDAQRTMKPGPQGLGSGH